MDAAINKFDYDDEIGSYTMAARLSRNLDSLFHGARGSTQRLQLIRTRPEAR